MIPAKNYTGNLSYGLKAKYNSFEGQQLKGLGQLFSYDESHQKT